jgi:hypothetical protein
MLKYVSVVVWKPTTYEILVKNLSYLKRMFFNYLNLEMKRHQVIP